MGARASGSTLHLKKNNPKGKEVAKQSACELQAKIHLRYNCGGTWGGRQVTQKTGQGTNVRKSQDVLEEMQGTVLPYVPA